MESIVCKQQRKEILSLPHSTQLFWIYFWTGHCLSLGKKGGSEKVFKGRKGGGEGDSRRQQTIKKFTASQPPMIGDHKNIPKPYGGIR